MNQKTSDARQKLDRAHRQCPIDTVWEHKKGGIYTVLGHTIDTTDGQVLVRYRRVGFATGLRVADEIEGFSAVAERSIEFSRPLWEFCEAGRFTRVE